MTADASIPKRGFPGIERGTRVEVANQRGTVVSVGDFRVQSRPNRLVIVELDHGLWCWDSMLSRSTKSCDGEQACAFVSLLVADPENLEVIE